MLFCFAPVPYLHTTLDLNLICGLLLRNFAEILSFTIYSNTHILVSKSISADSSSTRHATKVYRGDAFKLDIDGRLVDKDEAFV